MNRTVKEEFGMDRRIKSKELVKKLVEESVFFMQPEKTSLALKMKTPDQVYYENISAT